MSAARKPVRMCVRCARITDDPVVVSEVHQATGPGFNVYACSTCAPHFPRVPDVLDLLEEALASRRTTEEITADSRTSGRTQECESSEHDECTPMEVYESDDPAPDELPFFSITCTCACHSA
ncbi:hypothetical protein [Streptomyces fradiae]|uniref:hypothetical protein n=1 Tax=Streptomyces fradiae TaxID=1906 RepID=UPI003666C943